MKRKKKRKSAPAWQIRLKLDRIPDLLEKADRNIKINNRHQAQQLYEKVLKIDPDNETAINRLAENAVHLELFDQAEKYLKRAIRINSTNISYRNNLAQVYCCQRRWDDALDISRSVLQEDSSNYYALSNMGIALKGAGELKQSILYFRKMLDRKPDAMLPLTILCELYNSLKMNKELLALLKSMESLFASLKSAKERAGLCFVLGRYYDYMDEYESAFNWFSKGNNLKKQAIEYYNFESEAAFIRRNLQNIDADFIKTYENCGIDNPAPIFIVGMPRSGTTLIEQILSGHTQVSAAGELDFMRQLAGMFDRSAPRSSVRLIASNYLHAISTYAKGADHVTDKMPQNFMFAGLIHAALPEASIIQCRRDPMDTCFSCYKQDFTGHHEYSYDLHTLGQYYVLYDEVMRHWNSVIPGTMLEVRYEEVVGDMEFQVRRILEFCGLEWEEQCLDYYRSDRKVRTSSWDQVNRPVYDTSIGRWRKYAKHLQSLYDVLKPLYT